MHRQVVITKYTTLSLGGPGCPRLPYMILSVLTRYCAVVLRYSFVNIERRLIHQLNIENISEFVHFLDFASIYKCMFL